MVRSRAQEVQLHRPASIAASASSRSVQYCLIRPAVSRSGSFGCVSATALLESPFAVNPTTMMAPSAQSSRMDLGAVALAHTKLPDREAADRIKQYWTERLDALGAVLADR